MDGMQPFPHQAVPVCCGDELVLNGDVIGERDILEKVLMYRLVDGIQDCCLVCHRWYAACHTLPVHLGCIPPERLQEVTRRFCNAASVSIVIERDEENVMLQQIQEFRRLERLALEYHAPYSDRAGFRSCFQSLTTLRELDIVVHEEHVREWLCHALRYLTRLTSLELEVMEGAVFDLMPFTELQNIEHLSVTANMLLNKDDQPMFPSSTHLTCLSLIELKDPPYLHGMDVLQSVLPFAASLCKLELLFDPEQRKTLEDWTPLKKFTSLESIGMMTSDLCSTNFFEAIVGSNGMTELIVGTVDISNASDMGALASLTGLKTLSIASYPETMDIDRSRYPFQQLTRLTRLVIEEIHVGTSICCLTGLVALDINTSDEMDIDELTFLSHMPLLQELSLRLVSSTEMLWNIIYGLTLLRSLSLYLSTEVVSHSVRGLTALKNLTELCFGYDTECASRETLVTLNELHNLQHLEIDVETEERPSNYLFKEDLQRLKTLIVRRPKLSESEKENLRSMFHSLKSVENSESILMGSDDSSFSSI